ncbi:hypothetical protein [Kribbella kalugense]|uniref:Uncharacterized protein n=1 Tax=Kribbella kalugense TaxID=2512221 RepID=A0A4V3G7C2_9ACTN|nr:hypothetical protein [Kribbella kalugense]TDW18524.1 hypothetical protein EV650_5112 [Kribbella kalugense]
MTDGITPEQLDRLRRREAFLRERDEVRALRDRTAPRRARVWQLGEALRRAVTEGEGEPPAHHNYAGCGVAPPEPPVETQS